jgi:hypothetical protein
VAVDNMRALMRVCLARGDAAVGTLEQAVASRDAHHALDMQKLSARMRELVRARTLIAGGGPRFVHGCPPCVERELDS